MLQPVLSELQPLLRARLDAALAEWVDAGAPSSHLRIAAGDQEGLALALALATNAAEVALIVLDLAETKSFPDGGDARLGGGHECAAVAAALPSLGLTTLARHEFYGFWLRAHAVGMPEAVPASPHAALAPPSAALKKLLAVLPSRAARDTISAFEFAVARSRAEARGECTDAEQQRLRVLAASIGLPPERAEPMISAPAAEAEPFDPLDF